MAQKTCCVTGHREISDEKEAYVKNELRLEVLRAIRSGYTHFISGFADGADLWFAEIIVKQMKRHPEITLEAAIPYEGRRKRLMAVEAHSALLEKCSKVKVIAEKYNPGCYFARNRYMASQSDMVIAVYDGRETGGTEFTIRYAQVMGKMVRIIKI